MAKTLTDLFFDQLQDAYNAETQLTKALPKMAKAAKSAELHARLRATSAGDTKPGHADWRAFASRSAARPARTPARR